MTKCPIVGNKAKGRISTRVFQENKSRQFSKNEHFLPPDTENFSENLACFVFLKHQFWVSPFCFITVAIEVGTTSILLPNALTVSSQKLMIIWTISIEDLENRSVKAAL